MPARAGITAGIFTIEYMLYTVSHLPFVKFLLIHTNAFLT